MGYGEHMASRAEHRLQTLHALSDAAIACFEADASATVQAIASAAGVSRRTVFRYVDSREELAFIHPLLWFDAFDGALDAHATEPLVERLRIASAAIGAAVDADPEPPRRAFRVAAATPELHRGFQTIFQRWVDRVAEVVAEAEGPTADPIRPRIVGGAVMGMVDAVTREWVLSSPEVRYSSLIDAGFETLRPMFEAI